MDAGYIFIDPQRIKNGDLSEDKHYALITFDDGYFNNYNILPILATYNVPAVFYFPTAYLTNGKKFWSDALYTARKKQNKSDEEILKEIMYLKSLRLSDIENYLTKEFTASILDSNDDISRFMTVEEFKSFADYPNVYIGNHTHNHEVLTNLTEQEVLLEFEQSQDILNDLLETKIDTVSYPNGSYNNSIIKIAQTLDLNIGITTIMEKNYFPLENIIHNQLILHRFNPVVKNNKIDASNFRSDFQLKTKLKKWLS